MFSQAHWEQERAENRMILSDWLRERTRKITDPMTRLLCRTGISPNLLTVIGFLFNVVVAWIVALGHQRSAGILLTLGSLCDFFDGALARQSAQTSRFGAFLDSVLDRFSESVIFLGLLWYAFVRSDQTSLLLVYVTIISSLLVSYIRARADGIGVECRVGYGTRFERMMILMAGLILRQVEWTLWILATLSILTVLHRVYYVWRATRGGKA